MGDWVERRQGNFGAEEWTQVDNAVVAAFLGAQGSSCLCRGLVCRGPFGSGDVPVHWIGWLRGISCGEATPDQDPVPPARVRTPVSTRQTGIAEYIALGTQERSAPGFVVERLQRSWVWTSVPWGDGTARQARHAFASSLYVAVRGPFKTCDAPIHWFIDVCIFSARTIQALGPQIWASVVSPAIIGNAGPDR